MRAARIRRAVRWADLVTGRRAAHIVARMEALATQAHEENAAGDLASAARLLGATGTVNLDPSATANVARAISVQC